jgi:hypothetical protein
MATYLSPTGHEILGTLERLSGRAEIVGIDPTTGEPEYQGGTTIFYDDQETVWRKGHRVFLDSDGGEWTFDQLVLEEDEEDDGCPKGDPECLGNNGDCHDACEPVSAEARI